MLAGMDLFDASCHAFGTLATGGFSTRNGSVAAFDSATIEWIIIVFMFLAGTNFLLHYRILFHRDFKVLSPNREFHVYTLTVIGATLLIAIILSGWGLLDASVTQHHFQDAPRTEAEHIAHVAAEEAKFDTLEGALRTSAFQVLAVVTTTGFGTADFDVWPRTLGLLLILLMFMGACAGSTSGGMKVIRIMVVFKTGWRELKKIVRPHLMAPLKVRGEVLPEPKVMNIVGFFILFMLLFGFFSLVMTLFIPDLTTAVTSVIATIGDIGPGLGGVGPSQSYHWIPLGGKWVLVFCMLLGRLEIFTVLVLFRLSFWKG